MPDLNLCHQFKSKNLGFCTNDTAALKTIHQSHHFISEFGGPGADIIRGQDNRQKCRPEIGAGRHREENKSLANICSVCSQARWG